jgi:hypothetical protein
VKQPTHDRQQWIRQAVEQYERPLVLYAWRLTMNLELAREVVQDTFLKLCDQTPEDIQDHLAQSVAGCGSQGETHETPERTRSSGEGSADAST